MSAATTVDLTAAGLGMPDNIAVAFDTASTFVHVSELLLLPFCT